MDTKELAEITLKHIECSMGIVREKLEDPRLTTDQWLRVLCWMDELTEKTAEVMEKLDYTTTLDESNYHGE